MSICKNVGGLATYLNKNCCKELSFKIKRCTCCKDVFEDIGLKYFGIVDGHNIRELNEVLSIAKK